MPDITTFWDPVNSRGDWAIIGEGPPAILTESALELDTEDGQFLAIEGAIGRVVDLASGDDLATACLISVFTDAQADSDDVLPPGVTDRRGWWGDPTIGSKIWLLRRSKLNAAVAAKAKTYLQRALKWLTDDGVAARVDVVTELGGVARLNAQVTVLMSDGRRRLFAYAWAWAEI